MVESFCTVLWLLWYNKGKCFHNKHCGLLEFLTTKALRFVEEFDSLRIQLQGDKLPPRSVSWSPPHPLMLKVNIDVASDQS